MLNGDIITNLEISRLMDLRGCVGALALVPLRSSYGIVDTEPDGKISRFREKPELPAYWINAGVYHLTPDVFSYLEYHTDIETTAFPKLAEEGRLLAVKYDRCFWRSIDVYKDIEEVEKDLKKLEGSRGS